MVSCAIIVCAASSPSKVGQGGVEVVSPSGSGVMVLMRGGMRCGECPDLSENGEKPVDAFTVFIMSKQTLGNAFTQPV